MLTHASVIKVSCLYSTLQNHNYQISAKEKKTFVNDVKNNITDYLTGWKKKLILECLLYAFITISITMSYCNITITVIQNTPKWIVLFLKAHMQPCKDILFVVNQY